MPLILSSPALLSPDLTAGDEAGGEGHAVVLPEDCTPEAELRPYCWTIDEYHRAIEQNVFAPGDRRVELIDAQLLERLNPTPQHVFYLEIIFYLLFNLYGKNARVLSQQPLILDNSEPVPDVMVVRGTLLDYRDRHPNAADTLLVIEVANSTLQFDHQRKATLYARNQILDYWVLDIRHQCLWVHRQPTTAGYQAIRQLQPGETIRPLAVELAAQEIAIAQCFGQEL